MKICPNGHAVNDDVKYCPTCGAEIIGGNKFCTKCGSVRKGTEKYCSHCGTPFDSSNERMIFTEEKENRFKKYLPYILGTIVVLAIIGYFSSKSDSSSQSKTEIADSLAVVNETSVADNNTLIANYDERKVYSGEYVFDAVLTVSATLEKSESTFTIKVDGDKVSIPTDDGKTMTGFIFNDDLGIDVFYDYGDDLHYLSMNLKPNDREGKEWVGGFQPTGIYYDVVMKLKEVKRKGDAVRITKEREADNDNETAESENESSEYIEEYIYRAKNYIRFYSNFENNEDKKINVEINEEYH